MTFRVLVVTLLMACAETPVAPARTSAVSVPEWAEGTPSARPPQTLASTATTSLGTHEPRKPAHGKKITLDVVSADLANVCRLIGELAGVNIVIADGVTGTVTVKMHGVPWNEALDAILLSKGYHAEHVGSVIVVK